MTDVADLDGVLLDAWAVSAARHAREDAAPGYGSAPSANWSVGGPLIERFAVSVQPIERILHSTRLGEWQTWRATMSAPAAEQFGRSPLEAAMRCIIESVYGKAVESEVQDIQP